jgi:hypothetical protein
MAIISTFLSLVPPLGAAAQEEEELTAGAAAAAESVRVAMRWKVGREGRRVGGGALVVYEHTYTKIGSVAGLVFVRR